MYKYIECANCGKWIRSDDKNIDNTTIYSKYYEASHDVYCSKECAIQSFLENDIYEDNVWVALDNYGELVEDERVEN